MKKEINVLSEMRKKGFEDIGTGGGCYGYFKKKGTKAFYITTYSDLTLPELNEQVTLGVYDKDFETEFLVMDIKKFNPEKVDAYIEKAMKKLNQKRIKEKIKKAKNDEDFDVIYI